MLFAPAWITAEPLERRLLLLLIIRFGYNALHFAGQHYGVLSLYRLRARQDPRSAAKGVDKAFCFAAAGASMLLPFMLDAAARMSAPANALSGVRGAAAAALLTLAAWVAVNERAEGRPSWPKLLYVLTLAAVSAFALLGPHPERTALLIAVQHYVVATGLCTRMVVHSTDGLGRRAWTPATAFAALFAIGLVPVLLGYRSAHIDTVDWLFASWWDNDELGLAFRLSAALVYGLSFAHNAWDAAVFRFRDPAVRAVSVPLLLGPDGPREPALTGGGRLAGPVEALEIARLADGDRDHRLG